MIKLSERYYDEYFGDVYGIIVNGEEVGFVDFEEETDYVSVHLLTIRSDKRGNGYARGTVDLLKSMFPGKNLEGSSQGRGSTFWKSMGATLRPDPDDNWFSIFELSNKEVN